MSRFLVLLLLLSSLSAAHAESMVQYFNTSWKEITQKMPELAEAGYDSIWVPPPTKGSGGLSVGYDLWDRFDLGSKDQRGSISTRYGTEAELLDLLKVAHRFGIRIYFDNIMNHNAFDIPGYNAGTSINIYPGFVPEDFHLRVTEDGFYRKWDNTRNWGDAWQVQNLGLADLIDIAAEPGTLNYNHGTSEGSTIQKISFVRSPQNPERYCYKPSAAGQKHSFDQGTYVGFGPNNGITVAEIAGNADFYSEYVEDYLHRAARWLIDHTKVDGLRLDAVKHVPDSFFGALGAGADSSNYGYTGKVQQQFNLSRGFSDWGNHRDSVFDTERARDDAMLFGEHLGQPPSYAGYVDRGMRLVDNDLRSNFNNLLGNPSSGLNGYDQPGSGGFAPGVAVTHAQSHDNDYAARRELQHAFYFTRAGLPLVYTDGNHHAETLGASGGAFPRHANTAFLGQFADPRIPNLTWIHQHFARGYQQPRWSDADFVAYERIDKREGGTMTDADGVTMLIMLNDNFASGQARGISTSFPAQGGTANDAYLFNYSTYNGPFYTYASNLSSVVVPPGGYFIFSYRSPEEASGWKDAGGKAVTIHQGGVTVPTMLVSYKDGPDGDPGYSPAFAADKVSDGSSTDYKYSKRIPRVTDASNLSFIARADGSAENVLLRLDAGVPLNAANHTLGDPRDNPPGIASDVFMGYEQAIFSQRIFPEKFSAKDTARCKWGSAGAETYAKTIGSGGFTVTNGSGTNPLDGDAASFFYHDPENQVGGIAPGTLQYSEGTNDLTLWGKVNSVGAGYKMFVYYTTDGSNPEGAGGAGIGSTQVAELTYQHNDDGGATDWWKVIITPKPAGQLRYKMGVYKTGASSVFPSGASQVARKMNMLTQFQVTGINANTVQHRPHADYSTTETGLEEGMHVVRGRAFLSRAGKASIYNTFFQPFYLDQQRPTGEIAFPTESSTIGGQSYGCVVRTDKSVTEVWYCIDDAQPANDDTALTLVPATPVKNGNGLGKWVKAKEVIPSATVTSAYPKEWRFDYLNLPGGNTAAHIHVRLVEASSDNAGTLAESTTISPADDLAKHYTTLTRNVIANGPDQRLYIAYPGADGDVVGAGYTMKCLFSKSLADGKSEQELIDEFLITIGSRTSGSLEGASVKSRADYDIVYNETADYHALAYTLPNLYNRDPDFLHYIEVKHTRNSITTSTSRLVRAVPVVDPFLSITTPPEYDSDGKPYEIVLKDLPPPVSPTERQFTIRAITDPSITQLTLAFELGSGTTVLNAGSPVTSGAQKIWDFTWSAMSAGKYVIKLEGRQTTGGAVVVTERRNITVVLQQLEVEDEFDADDDDDGLTDVDELEPRVLPTTNSETWTNGQVHITFAYGKTNPLSPDTDSDGIHDATEIGYRGTVTPDTNAAADTNGDGRLNFAPDLDPPFFNTVPDNSGLPLYNLNESRTKMIHGSMTDPHDPDSDDDGIMDGKEDSNRNGWVEGDGAALPAPNGSVTGRNWPNNKIDLGETWTETNPNDSDTDDDGLSDGTGEDKDGSGSINGDSDGNRVYDAGETWSETNPLSKDTDGDGLLDGWEVANGLDPLDNGTDNLRTATPNDGNLDNGGSGNPDGDSFNNTQEQTNGTKPKVADNGTPPPASSIVIGEGTTVTRGLAVNKNSFTDWSLEDLVEFDEFEGDGGNNQGGDVYPGGDGADGSRDIVAFYAHDGGLDGKYYFRIDFHDLAAYAEDDKMNAYILIDMGNTAIGEKALPDDVDILTDMGWEVAVAAYRTNVGSVYVDTNHSANSIALNEGLVGTNGVVVRDQNTADGFLASFYDSSNDSMELSISRQALVDAGWNGINALRFQVYTTKDGTINSPVGAGNLGGRNDVRDSIYDDWVAEDYYDQQLYVKANEKLKSWITVDGQGRYPAQRKSAKLVLLTHTAQPLLSGGETQALINSGFSTGLHRVVDTHEAFGKPAALHFTPTLASSIEWAKVDPAKNKPWRDGPSFNNRMAAQISAGNLQLLGTTFSDHILAYFDSAYTADNTALASSVMQQIYGMAPSSTVFWNPERVADHTVMSKISSAGYTFSFIDQMRHIWKWYGRDTALSDDGYRINTINGLKCFVINDQASQYRYRTADNGLSMPMRMLLHRKARSGTQDQVVILYHDWSEFTSTTQAAAYDTNLRWAANHPWVQIVTPQQIAANQVDINRDGTGDSWFAINRGNGSLARVAHDWVDHATQENYDNWFNGQPGREEGLRDKVFDIRTGVALPYAFGTQALNDNLLADRVWDSLSLMHGSHSVLGTLARGTMHSGMYLTAFHNQLNGDTSKYSTGAYVSADTDNNTLQQSAAASQARARGAAMLSYVNAWHASPPSEASTQTVDVDLDGENEYVLKNRTVFAVFERTGGRCVAAWCRNHTANKVFQVIGNLWSLPDSTTEEEGMFNDNGSAILARRTSAFKDWYAIGPNTAGYVNDLYTVTAAGIGTGWTLTSSDGKISKTITLENSSLKAAYLLTGNITKLYLRHGLSPHLLDLYLNGQGNLSSLNATATGVTLTNSADAASPVTAELVLSGGSYGGVVYNPTATDQGATFLPDTYAMLNQAQTRQVELESTATSFSFGLDLSSGPPSPDMDGDNLPDLWENANGLSSGSNAGADGAAGDPDGDGITNMGEYLVGLNPQSKDEHLFPKLTILPTAGSSYTLDFPTLGERRYKLWYSHDMDSWLQVGADILTTGESANPHRQVLDNGTPAGTTSHPSTQQRRFYKLEISLP
jgi:glycosidase